MHHLSDKELMHLEDHLKMEELMVKKLDHCSQLSTDQEIKTLCGKLIQGHRDNFQKVLKHLNDKKLQ